MGETCLSEAREEVAKFMGDILSMARPRWLALCGHSGNGKTLLARKFGRFMRKRGQFYTEPTTGANLVRQWGWWGEDELARDLRDGNFNLINDLSRAWLLVIDDLGFSNDNTGFITSAIGELLNRRAGKWTLITSNLCVEDWANRDPRIASRLIRDENKVVRMTCQDYALRRSAA